MFSRRQLTHGTGIGLVCSILLSTVPQDGVAAVHLFVGTPEQGGQYATVQEAVDAVPGTSEQPNDKRYVINIMPGTYMERVIIPTYKPMIMLRGEDPMTTKLTFNEPADAEPNENTNHASTVVQGTDFVAENITFENS